MPTADARRELLTARFTIAEAATATYLMVVGFENAAAKF
jgi:hypothetical protein